ncbi:hypothetical protein GO013_03885 [Pseudodesulfovibrio sp. JC047]|uniref:hypothetical protein n=1 Tax=Pseudodesulfovibrio sp. JC047 TaxID=2683199 RepID=UPI0013D52CE9|nr:hypothetical protein [Pseudodesulfovibrio sp. JC047]NDV18559.1 hypothetical protein [Pseudodesulfovibrio sp. JC047]
MGIVVEPLEEWNAGVLLERALTGVIRAQKMMSAQQQIFADLKRTVQVGIQ